MKKQLLSSFTTALIFTGFFTTSAHGLPAGETSLSTTQNVTSTNNTYVNAPQLFNDTALAGNTFEKNAYVVGTKGVYKTQLGYDYPSTPTWVASNTSAGKHKIVVGKKSNTVEVHHVALAENSNVLHVATYEENNSVGVVKEISLGYQNATADGELVDLKTSPDGMNTYALISVSTSDGTQAVVVNINTGEITPVVNTTMSGAVPYYSLGVSNEEVVVGWINQESENKGHKQVYYTTLNNPMVAVAVSSNENSTYKRGAAPLFAAADDGTLYMAVLWGDDTYSSKNGEVNLYRKSVNGALAPVGTPMSITASKGDFGAGNGALLSVEANNLYFYSDVTGTLYTKNINAHVWEKVIENIQLTTLTASTGMHAVDDVKVTYDDVYEPELNVEFETINNRVKATASAQEDHGDLATATCKINDTTFAVDLKIGKTLCSIDTELQAGNHTFSVSATDGRGNTAQVVRNFEIKAPSTNPPVVTPPVTNPPVVEQPIDRRAWISLNKTGFTTESFIKIETAKKDPALLTQMSTYMITPAGKSYSNTKFVSARFNQQLQPGNLNCYKVRTVEKTATGDKFGPWSKSLCVARQGDSQYTFTFAKNTTTKVVRDKLAFLGGSAIAMRSAGDRVQARYNTHKNHSVAIVNLNGGRQKVGVFFNGKRIGTITTHGITKYRTNYRIKLPKGKPGKLELRKESNGSWLILDQVTFL